MLSWLRQLVDRLTQRDRVSPELLDLGERQLESAVNASRTTILLRSKNSCAFWASKRKAPIAHIAGSR